MAGAAQALITQLKEIIQPAQLLQLVLEVVKQRPALTGSTLVGFALLLLRYIQSRKPTLLHDLSSGKTLDLDYAGYDIIIVGGGTSACVLAARLSEDPKLRVLMLEAGVSGKSLPATRIPSAFGSLFYKKHVWNFRTEPQVFAAGQSRYWPRAKMLGGCSSINAQMAQYGAPSDFDEWASFIGDPSWAWSNFQKYFRKFEKFHPDPEYPLVDVSTRGKDGPVDVGYFSHVSNASKQFITACVGVGIPFTPDFNHPERGTMGVSRVMTYIDKKRERVSTETAYLTDEVLKRPNLTVVINAQVTKILFDTSDGLRASGVEFQNAPGGRVFRARAGKEVVLSAGAVHSPHILMLSGVGPAEHLKAHNIPVVLDLPGVGANLVDHPDVATYFKDKLNLSLRYLKPTNIIHVLKIFKALFQYKLFQRGPLATNFGDSVAFVRSDDPLLFPESAYKKIAVDSTSAVGSPDLELFCTPFSMKEHGKITFPMDTFGLHVYLVRPTSRGEVLLKSSNPWDLPSVNPNYLQTPEDLEKLVRGVKLCLRIAQTDPLASHLDQDSVLTTLDHQRHLSTDEEIATLVKERCETVYHPTSTCRMGPKDQGGVCDAKLRVYGVAGLRVCDASFFPWIVSGHTAGACIASAEKLADMLKKEYSVV